MALRDEMRLLASDVFDEFDDIPRTATLTRPQRPVRDAAGTVTDVPASYATRVVLTEGVAADPVTGLVAQHDATALIPARELAVEPRTGDRLAVDGRTFAIAEHGVATDEARALWTCRLRALSL